MSHNYTKHTACSGKLRTQKPLGETQCHCEAIPDEKHGLATGQPEIEIVISVILGIIVCRRERLSRTASSTHVESSQR